MARHNCTVGRLFHEHCIQKCTFKEVNSLSRGMINLHLKSYFTSEETSGWVVCPLHNPESGNEYGGDRQYPEDPVIMDKETQTEDSIQDSRNDFFHSQDSNDSLTDANPFKNCLKRIEKIVDRFSKSPRQDTEDVLHPPDSQSLLESQEEYYQDTEDVLHPPDCQSLMESQEEYYKETQTEDSIQDSRNDFVHSQDSNDSLTDANPFNPFKNWSKRIEKIVDSEKRFSKRPRLQDTEDVLHPPDSQSLLESQEEYYQEKIISTRQRLQDTEDVLHPPDSQSLLESQEEYYQEDTESFAIYGERTVLVHQVLVKETQNL